MAQTIREAYGNALVKYGKDDSRVVVLDADVASSTKSGIFAKACPERFYNVGIAEANMVAIAAGFASEGKVPFVNTFAAFLATIGILPARALGAYSNLNIKLMGAYGGMSDAYDGTTHHALEDLSIMRAIPNMQVMVASDEVQTDWLVKNAIETQGPMYIRLSRDVMPSLYSADEKFEAGKGKVIREGKDVTIIACGILCGFSIQAAEILAAEGISARVVDMFSLKPIDSELINRCAKETGAIVTAEEHNVLGALGGAVAEVLVKGDYPVPVEMIGLQDVFSQTGDYQSLLEHYGLTPKAIAEKVRAVLKRKKA